MFGYGLLIFDVVTIALFIVTSVVADEIELRVGATASVLVMTGTAATEGETPPQVSKALKRGRRTWQWGR